MTLAPAEAAVRTRITVTGTVQGVGFRPYVYRLARELALTGFVLNDSRGVVIEIEGSPQPVGEFLTRLEPEAPPLAELASVETETCPPSGQPGFAIAQSRHQAEPQVAVTIDTATCDDCLRELSDPDDRRYRYPFINCTNCGPRFTIVQGVPYDRPLTTMSGFQMCSRCQTEYEDPSDRRFHAQPNACPKCGPSLRLLDASGNDASVEAYLDPIQAAAAAIRAGAIVSIKGIGGYHLACRADEEPVVTELRARKHRDEKPFALMAPSIEATRELVTIDAEGEALLQSPARPIVLAPRAGGATVAASVAPQLRELGVMLPYTPLHHLLLADAGLALVMTSGNRSDEPIAYRDGDALERLSVIADLFLTHDRPIATRTDDSVLRTAAGRARVLRRSRGYVPSSLTLPIDTPPLLACGAELKNTFCVAKGRRAWVSHHIGDLKNWETLSSFREGIAHFCRLFAVDPYAAVHDLHPDYLATRYALEREDLQPIPVQHHHAHLAGCLAEHGESGPTIGVIYDGSGYGTDHTVWGGELLVGDLREFDRAAHLWPVALAGGDRAVKEPWRMACAWLLEAYGERRALPPRLRSSVAAPEWNAVSSLIAANVHCPSTTSVGRLFDAVCALCGIRTHVSYEGQAAIELEVAADRSERGHYEVPLTDELRLDARELVLAADYDLRKGLSPGVVSARFHRGLALATVHAAAVLADTYQIRTAALSGGVFQNRLLLELVAGGLRERGLRVLVPSRLPLGDGGISYGQAAVAAARLAGEAYS